MAILLAPTMFLTQGFASESPTAEEIEFFESRIRPVLVEHCYECHNSADTREGGLAVDHRLGIKEGGEGGAIVVPGQPEKSRLLKILRHEVDGLEMPQDGPQLEGQVLADFERWIAMGVPDPRDKPPTADEIATSTSWEAQLKRRKQWWSFQPIRSPSPPGTDNAHWSAHPVDRFVMARLDASGLEPSPPAEPSILVRRLFFNLVGLPPGADEVAYWTARLEEATSAGRAIVIEELVDELLNDPGFGERWARHWMDWIRYAESHGSEGDPAIVNAWMYRDYLIRALNADVPYDQLVREHIAGDLLDEPRINESLGINESLIGPAHWRMVFHGFSPTDPLDEKVRFTDDQINAFSKAFLGLTVSCARCHDHKFDAISQKDYYALFGILGSCRPARSVIDLPEGQHRHVDALSTLKPKIRAALAEEWLVTLRDLGERLAAADGPWLQADKPGSVLHPLFLVHQDLAKGVDFAQVWQNRSQAWRAGSKQRSKHLWREESVEHWNLASGKDYATWFPKGFGLPKRAQPAGEFSVAAVGDLALTGIYPSGVYSHLLSAKHPARLTSGNIEVGEDCELWVHAIGDRQASLRFVVQNYPRNGTIYPVKELSNVWSWQHFDLSYWNGDDIHIELTTAKDAPLLVKDKPRSWFGIREAAIVRKGHPTPSESSEHLSPLIDLTETSPQSVEDAARLIETAITSAVKAWQDDSTTDQEALLLDACLKQGLLANKLDTLPSSAPLIEQYRQLENEIPVPTRVPGLDETVGRNQRLFQRGNHKHPGDEVPRRFLEAIDATPYDTHLSGRRQLAEDLLREDNPLSRRVIVNRVWHHLFGRGIVDTPDNFGRLGTQPTHPELLDWLATRFVADEWSLKKLVRLIVTSKTWQLSSHTTPRAEQQDPGNQWLSHANVRRLEAEAIRDSLLAASGLLDRQQFGSPVKGNSPRRSIYVGVVRNSLDPFLRVFDFPEPFSAAGRRDATNVPAQSLTMMNDARVAEYAAAWAGRVLGDAQLSSDEERVERMFRVAFGRPASEVEVEKILAYLVSTQRRFEDQRAQLADAKQKITTRTASMNQLIDPVRKRLQSEAERSTGADLQNVPKPIGHWDFAKGLSDTVGSADGSLREGAQLREESLVVSGRAHVITAPLGRSLSEKTLQAWVQLDNLTQQGSGVMTIQTPDGVVFDAIVFGEKDPRQWLAGSNGFTRTQSFQAPEETDAVERPVHLAIVYHADGRIVGYRDGKPYGSAYQSAGPNEFEAGNAVIGFGIRHLPAGGNRMLAGKILRAQLYDYALSDEQVEAASRLAPYFVSESQVFAALSDSARRTLEGLRGEIATLEARVESFGPDADLVGEKAVWTDVASAIFTFKEFIYVQ